jgi:hypothetical protein
MKDKIIELIRLAPYKESVKGKEWTFDKHALTEFANSVVLDCLKTIIVEGNQEAGSIQAFNKITCDYDINIRFWDAWECMMAQLEEEK